MASTKGKSPSKARPSTTTKPKAKSTAKLSAVKDTPKAVKNLHFSTTNVLTEVDVKDVPEPKAAEPTTPLTGETWVVLGEHPNVPDWAVGKVAAVISAPTVPADPTDLVTVRERSQGAVFEVPLSSFDKVARTHGRLGIVHPA